MTADFWTGPMYGRLFVLVLWAGWSIACVCIGIMVQNHGAQRDYRRRLQAQNEARRRALYDYEEEAA